MDKWLSVSWAASENGEDSFALRSDERGAFLCVADGCGGLGSRRYESLQGHTGAYAASRLATRCTEQWLADLAAFPVDRREGAWACRSLEEALQHGMTSFAQAYCQQEKSRISGSMQRCLPTTLCAAVKREDRVCFLWAGDSRGYVLDEEGLHQCTADHLKGMPDAFESLYRDTPLSRLLSADMEIRLSAACVRLSGPSIILTATDGAYSALPSPMEFEMLLMDTLRKAKDWQDWEKRLQRAIGSAAQDDATLLMALHQMTDFASFRQSMLVRRERLQKTMITPVRRHKGDAAFARERWQEYRKNYDWTEGESHGRVDWRL